MTQASELRIGNWVSKDNEIFQINNIYGASGLVGLINSNNAYNRTSLVLGNINEIPLTEEWLIKLGFEKSDYLNFTKKVSALTITCRIQIGINYTEFGGIYFGDRFKYVHDMQNFIFSISGQELTIEDQFK